MANIKSAIKRIRSNERKRGYNRIVRSRARTMVKKTRQLIESGQLDEARAMMVQAVSALDKAANKGVIHRNKAARQKSRLMKQLNRAQG